MRKKLIMSLVAAAILGGCGGGGGSGASPTVNLPRTTENADTTVRRPPQVALPSGTATARLHNQPNLQQVGWAGAYTETKGFLTGRGVRIGINDDSIDILNDEFSGRIGFDAATLTYWDPDAGNHCGNSDTCTFYDVNSADDVLNKAREIILRDGYPNIDNTVYIRNTGTADRDFRYYEIPALNEIDPESRQPKRWHGTAVASIAAGTRMGVAPRATVIPMATPLENDNECQRAQKRATVDMLNQVEVQRRINMNDLDAMKFENQQIELVRRTYRNVDLINRSYGMSIFDDDWSRYTRFSNAIQNEQWLRSNMPQLYGVLTQTSIPASEQTVHIIAAGNSGEPMPNAGATRGTRIAELRGLYIAVVGVNEDGRLHRRSNHCGGLPSDWNAARDGRHFCLAAPWFARGVYPGSSSADSREVDGTSFATAIVSGGIALVLEQFQRDGRAQISPREATLRVLNTANQSGYYKNSRIYGAGLLNLNAATRPIGMLQTGTPTTNASLASTTLQIPAAWGDIGNRLSGIEFASFDSYNAPFWKNAESLFANSVPSQQTIPGFSDSSGQSGPLQYLAWTKLPSLNIPGLHDFQFSYSEETKQGVSSGAWNTFGLSFKPLGKHLRTGFIAETDSNLGMTSSGAFGNSIHSNMVWVEGKHQWKPESLPRWSIQSDWLIAFGRPRYESGTMFNATSSFYSSASLTLEHSDNNRRNLISISQPLRAESGYGTLHYSTGRTLEGDHLYSATRFPLAPNSREFQLKYRHDRKVGNGTLAFQITYSQNALHTRGIEHTAIGTAYKVHW